MNIRSELRGHGDCCRFCGALLADASALSRSWSKIKSGEWAGDDGKSGTLHCVYGRCLCGREVRLFWTVNMAPRQGGSA